MTKEPFLLIDIFTEILLISMQCTRQRKKISLKIPSYRCFNKEAHCNERKVGQTQDRADVFYLKKIAGEWKDEK